MMQLEELPNIGKTIAKKLHTIGIYTQKDLKEVGSVRAYKFLQAQSIAKLPICYNLYSLEGAIRGIKWTELSQEIKDKLKKEINRK